MKFRKLLLCLFAGICMTAFANNYTYAAEEGNIVTKDTLPGISTIQNLDLNTKADTTDTIDVTGTDTTAANENTTETTETQEVTDTEKETAEKEAAEKAAAEKAAKKKAAEKKAAEAKKKAAEKAAAAKKAAEKKAAEKKKVNYTKADLRLLSALIYCEANGESYNGKLAVGIVVMNRVRSNAYPDSIKSVIYQRYQFGPASNGSLNRALSQYDKGRFTSAQEKECIKAAKAALSGETGISIKGEQKNFKKYLYFSGRLSGHTYSLGNHQFK